MDYPNINENSIPDLDEWGWDDYWKCNDWITWHKIVKQKKGKTFADTIFLQYWNKQTFGASPLDCRSFNTAFRDYFKSENLLDAIYGSYGILKPLGAASDLIGSASDAASGIGKGLTRTSAVLSWAIPIVIILALTGGAYWAYNKFIKS